MLKTKRLCYFLSVVTLCFFCSSCQNIITTVMKSTLDVSNAELKEMRKTPEPGTLLTKNSALVLEGIDRYMGGNLMLSESTAKKAGIDLETEELDNVTGKTEDTLLVGAGVSQEAATAAGVETNKLIASYLSQIPVLIISRSPRLPVHHHLQSY